MLESKAKSIANSIGNLPWEMIMEFIMQMVQNCFPTTESMRSAKTMGPLKKAALGVWIRTHFGVRGRRRVEEIRSAILTELSNTDDESLDTVWQEVRHELEPIDFPF